MRRIYIYRCLLLAAVAGGPAKIAQASTTYASTTGQIALSGIVSARAAVNVAGLARPMVVDMQTIQGAATVFHLNRFTNSAAGVTVSLASDTEIPSLRDENGVSVPYVVRFGGRDVAFTGGEAELFATTRDDPDAGDDLQIVAPDRAVTAGKPLTDRLVLIITAR